ncbi:hypothetical protein GYMLUDRAFT_46270 [Collybiopsis luxurians FD-317 M1]|uniref:DUF6534 domain-containing protein n=1 Tax=Collybiopsis luxurians FD-317 M1 TaxID=944289 RepID=A0A0D0B2L2_9AGAR|nr:hypothetical protein GYMLUDRAFT_46270 [Collybiopsis luxurians FD-317 M1]
MDVSLLSGAILVASLFSFLAMGVVAVCLWIYYTNYPKDPIAFKILVTFMGTLAILDTVVGGYWAYLWNVTHWGDPTIFAYLPKVFIIETFCFGTACLTNQAFFAWRLWTITKRKNWWLPLFILANGLIQEAVVFWLMNLFNTDPLLIHLGKALPTGYAWLICAILGDASVTIGMVYYLRIKTSKGDMVVNASSRSVLNAIIVRTLQCNVLSLLSQVAMFVMFFLKSNPHVQAYFFFNDFIVVKVYVFSLLLTLNARKRMASKFDTSRTGGTSDNIALSNVQGAIASRNRTRLQLQTDPGVVSIQVHQEIDTDDSWKQDGTNSNYSERKIDYV